MSLIVVSCDCGCGCDERCANCAQALLVLMYVLILKTSWW